MSPDMIKKINEGASLFGGSTETIVTALPTDFATGKTIRDWYLSAERAKEKHQCHCGQCGGIAGR